jgi:hypothetical protein
MPDYVYLNNVRGYDHEDLFAKHAFYDLNSWGSQASIVAPSKNDVCVVASYVPSRRGEPRSGKDRHVVFKRYIFWQEEPMRASKSRGAALPQDRDYRVFFGRSVEPHVEILTKREAAQKKEYAPFFNRNGDFKHFSLLRVTHDQT